MNTAEAGMSERDIFEVIKGRRSVRTFDGKVLTEEDKSKLLEFLGQIENPFDIPVEFRFLEPRVNGLKSPVLKGETLYIGAKIKKVPHFEEAYGYSFEALVLYAWSLGIGTVWIGGTMNRENFERAMELGEDEIMPCVTPVGYPADKMAMREIMMRKALKADKRLELGDIIFDGEYGMPLEISDASELARAFEMVRLAPSTVNKQPWRIIMQGGNAHFYEKPDKGYESDETGDLHRIDIGIAMYHFAKGLEQANKSFSVNTENPGIDVPEGVKYIATFTY